MVLTSRERDPTRAEPRRDRAVARHCSPRRFGFSLVALDEGANADPYWATLDPADRRPRSVLVRGVAWKPGPRARRVWPRSR
jgi:hypothetical protein